MVYESTFENPADNNAHVSMSCYCHNYTVPLMLYYGELTHSGDLLLSDLCLRDY